VIVGWVSLSAGTSDLTTGGAGSGSIGCSLSDVGAGSSDLNSSAWTSCEFREDSTSDDVLVSSLA
jgi:hypothetical protein